MILILMIPLINTIAILMTSITIIILNHQQSKNGATRNMVTNHHKLAKHQEDGHQPSQGSYHKDDVHLHQVLHASPLNKAAPPHGRLVAP